jgi:dTMP kinase
MLDASSPAGRLIVLEGADGVGRTTLSALLREWLEGQGVAVVSAAAASSPLAAAGLAQARDSAGIDPATLALLQAATLADALERQVLPALRAGLVVLMDRYVYTPIARGLVRGLDGDWLADVFAFAPPPDVALYLDADVVDLAPRVLARGGPGYRESGSDVLAGADRWANFRLYQGLLLQEYREIAAALSFITINTRPGVGATFLAAATAVARTLGAPPALPGVAQLPAPDTSSAAANGRDHSDAPSSVSPTERTSLTAHPTSPTLYGRPQR